MDETTKQPNTCHNIAELFKKYQRHNNIRNKTVTYQDVEQVVQKCKNLYCSATLLSRGTRGKDNTEERQMPKSSKAKDN